MRHQRHLLLLFYSFVYWVLFVCKRQDSWFARIHLFTRHWSVSHYCLWVPRLSSSSCYYGCLRSRWLLMLFPVKVGPKLPFPYSPSFDSFFFFSLSPWLLSEKLRALLQPAPQSDLVVHLSWSGISIRLKKKLLPLKSGTRVDDCFERRSREERVGGVGEKERRRIWKVKVGEDRRGGGKRKKISFSQRRTWIFWKSLVNRNWWEVTLSEKKKGGGGRHVVVEDVRATGKEKQ